MRLRKISQKAPQKVSSNLNAYFSSSTCKADEWILCLFATFLAQSVHDSTIKVYLSGVRFSMWRRGSLLYSCQDEGIQDRPLLQGAEIHIGLGVYSLYAVRDMMAYLVKQAHVSASRWLLPALHTSHGLVETDIVSSWHARELFEPQLSHRCSNSDYP